MLSTDWGTAWLMTGIGFGVVFAILVLLVLVLSCFSIFFTLLDRPAKAAPVASGASVAPVASASEADKAAVAVALHLYMSDAHDEESGVLTIQQTPYSEWHEVLNTRL